MRPRPMKAARTGRSYGTNVMIGALSLKVRSADRPFYLLLEDDGFETKPTPRAGAGL